VGIGLFEFLPAFA